MSHARPLLGAVLTAAAIAAAGCGSSNDGGAAPSSTAAAAKPATTAAAPSAATAKRPSKAEYVRRADRECRAAGEVSRQANVAVRKAFAANDAAGAAALIETFGPKYAKHIANVERMTPPAGDTRVLLGLLKVLDGQVRALRNEALALRSKDSKKLQEITQSQQQALQFAETLGKAYGFKVCGRAA